ncbi:unnamed protein product [Caenorhabditis sp. 36 PRJEB53466]|nr:unnamed protein product [Caenorhabditis sp. 36 PRJEB53466]
MLRNLCSTALRLGRQPRFLSNAASGDGEDGKGPKAKDVIDDELLKAIDGVAKEIHPQNGVEKKTLKNTLINRLVATEKATFDAAAASASGEMLDDQALLGLLADVAGEAKVEKKLPPKSAQLRQEKRGLVLLRKEIFYQAVQSGFTTEEARIKSETIVNEAQVKLAEQRKGLLNDVEEKLEQEETEQIERSEKEQKLFALAMEFMEKIYRDDVINSDARKPVNVDANAIKLFDQRPLGIWKKTEQYEQQSLGFWSQWDQRAASITNNSFGPTNSFEEQIQWTAKGKQWEYPIDNEFKIGDEANVSFIDHIFLDRHLPSTPELNAGMKPSTSKTASSSAATPPPDEPTLPYVNDNLPNPDDEPFLSDMRGVLSGDEIARQKSQIAHAKFMKTRPEMIQSQRAVTAQLFQRYTDDEERKRIEQQKNKEAMTVSATPVSRNGQSHDSRKRRIDPTTANAEEGWNRTQQQQQQQQHWMGQQHGYQHMQQHQFQQQQQQYMMMQQQHHMAAQQQQQHMQMQQPHHQQMPSTSSAESVRSVPTPASMHQPSPAEIQRNGSGMAMLVSPPSSANGVTLLDDTPLLVPEGEWFDKLTIEVAENYKPEPIDPDTYESVFRELSLPDTTIPDRLPSAPPPVHQPPQTPQSIQQAQQLQQQQEQKMRLLQQQQMEQQRHHQMMQQQQMLMQQQQQRQMQHPMNGAGFAASQQQAAYMQQQQQLRMQQLRYQQQQQQHHQQQQQMMAYGMPGYAPQMNMHHPSAYAAHPAHHMPQHTPFANIN